MQAIAAFVLRGRNQAILSVIGFATLALFFTPFGLFSAASIGLVTLVHGARQGLMITIIASVFMLLITGISGRIGLGFEYIIFYWLPMWFLARLLGRYNSLSHTVMVASGLGFIASIVLAVLYSNYEAEWNKLIIENFMPIFENAKMDMSKDDIRLFLINVGKWVVQYGAAYWVLSMSASLFIARWWQSLVFHPGGFGEEYRQLRFGLISAIAGLALFALAFIVNTGLLGEIFVSVAAIIVLVFLFQGLAIAHYVAAARKLRAVWLFIVYIAMLLLMPYELLLIALIGLSDNWVNYRSRVKQV